MTENKYKVQRTNDGRYCYPYKMASATATIVIGTSSGRILLARRSRDADAFPEYLSLPGGFLNVGEETIEKTIIRETFEELFLEIKEEDINLLYVGSKPGADPRYEQVVNVCYFCVIDESTIPSMRPNDDIDEILFINQEQVRDYSEKLAFNHKEILDEAMANQHFIAKINPQQTPKDSIVD